MSREGRGTMEKVLENTVRDTPEGIEPISDSFASLLVPELNTNTDAFLTVY